MPEIPEVCAGSVEVSATKPAVAVLKAELTLAEVGCNGTFYGPTVQNSLADVVPNCVLREAVG